MNKSKINIRKNKRTRRTRRIRTRNKRTRRIKRVRTRVRNKKTIGGMITYTLNGRMTRDPEILHEGKEFF